MAGGVQEELHLNPFFKALKTKHGRLYAEAERACSLICVPQALACPSDVDLELIQDHVFQPSPYFAGQFQSLSGKAIDITDNNINTKSGFSNAKRVQILFEELFYNQEYKSYRVLCIDEPLTGSSLKSLPTALSFPIGRSFEDCFNYLDSFEENKIVLVKLKDTAEGFNTSYVFVKGFHEHARKRVGAIVEQGNDYLLCANPDFRRLYNEDSPKLIDLYQVIESYLLGIMQERLFTDYTTILYKDEDDRINIIKSKLRHLTQQDLGVRTELQCDMKQATQKLDLLDDCSTPLEKLLALYNVINTVSDTVSEHLMMTGYHDTIATDDLIPIIVHVIINSSLRTTMSNLHYVENFIFSNVSNTSLGFTLVTFRAAVGYLDGDHVHKVFLKDDAPVISPRTRVLVSQPSRTSFRTSMIVDESMFRHVNANSNHTSPTNELSRSASHSDRDRDANRMERDRAKTMSSDQVMRKKVEVVAEKIAVVTVRPPEVIDMRSSDAADDALDNFKNKLQRSSTWYQS